MPSVSQYPKDKVPNENFLKDTQNVMMGSFKTCIDCRKYMQSIRKKTKDKGLLSREMVQKGLTDFLFCVSDHHLVCSKYARDKVPKNLFVKDQNDNEKGYYKTCSNCREYANTNFDIRIQGYKNEAENNNKILCRKCKKQKFSNEMAFNKDGTTSKDCIDCKNKVCIENLKRQEWFNNVRLDFILEYGSSCQRCKKIYLKPLTGTEYVQEIDTWDEKGILMVNHNNIKYNAKQFCSSNKEILELRVIDMDHLTEKEQRERGILKQSDPYVGKVERVSNMGTEYGMRKEAKKCQHLCKRCHVITTESREKGGNEVSKATIEKKDLCKYIENKK